jgi:nucleotide-binding universal stress UspA family protein
MMPAMYRRVLIVHARQRVERGLLEYGALLASLDAESRTLVTALPSRNVLRTLAPMARAIFEAKGVSGLSARVLPEPDLDAVFEAAAEWQADLLVVPHPRSLRGGRALARRLLTGAPCSVCFVPRRATARITCAVAGVELSAQGKDLLCGVVRLCTRAGSEELIALHAYFPETLAADERVAERQRDDALLDLYRLLPRPELKDLDCTPLVQLTASHGNALLQAVRGRRADLVAVGRFGIADVPLANPSREVEELLWECPVPLLQVLLSDHRIPLREVVQKRVFPLPEPVFN